MSGPEPGMAPRANAPVIKFDVDHARHLVTLTMRELALRPEEALEDAVVAYCTEKNLREVIARCVVDVVAEIVRDEVDRYYRKGEGRKVVIDAILAVLRERRGGDAKAT